MPHKPLKRPFNLFAWVDLRGREVVFSSKAGTCRRRAQFLVFFRSWARMDCRNQVRADVRVTGLCTYTQIATHDTSKECFSWPLFHVMGTQRKSGNLKSQDALSARGKAKLFPKSQLLHGCPWYKFSQDVCLPLPRSVVVMFTSPRRAGPLLVGTLSGPTC